MGILSTSAERAQSNITKAEATVSEWQAKAATARAEAAELDATAGAAILEDETSAERISLSIQTLERNAGAYEQAATEAARKLVEAQRSALEAEADELDKAAVQARKISNAHDTKVSGLLKQLMDIDGCEYEPGRSRDPISMEYGFKQNPRSIALRNEAIRQEARAASIKYYLKVGKAPLDYAELNEVTGTQFDPSRLFYEDAPVPASIRVYTNRGLTLQGA